MDDPISEIRAEKDPNSSAKARSLLDKAIVKIWHKQRPKDNVIDFQAEPHKTLYNFLEMWGNDRNNIILEDKVKDIYEMLAPYGDISSMMMLILGHIGRPVNEHRVDQVWRYLKIKEEANKVTHYLDTLRERLEGFEGSYSRDGVDREKAL